MEHKNRLREAVSRIISMTMPFVCIGIISIATAHAGPSHKTTSRVEIQGPCANIDFYNGGGNGICKHHQTGIVYTTRRGRSYQMLKFYRHLCQRSGFSGYCCKYYSNRGKYESWRKCYFYRRGVYQGYYESINFINSRLGFIANIRYRNAPPPGVTLYNGDGTDSSILDMLDDDDT